MRRKKNSGRSYRKTEAQDRIDASQETQLQSEKQLAEAVAASEQRDDAAEINDAVNKRLEALNKFAAIMPEDYKFDGEDEGQIMAARISERL